jgi:hypothetical protein
MVVRSIHTEVARVQLGFAGQVLGGRNHLFFTVLFLERALRMVIWYILIKQE